MTLFRNSAAILTIAALSLSQAAEAKKKASECITEAEVVGLLRYSIPSVIEGVAQKCQGRVSPSGFLSTSAEAMIAKFSEGRDEAWPTARIAFMKLGGDKDSRELIDGFTDEALQPLVAEAISGVMLEEVKPENCAEAEHLLEATNRIAPEDLSVFLGALLAMAIGPKDKEMPICEA